MFQENSIETCILSRVKQIAGPGWMHETSARTWCSGRTWRERVGREVGGGIRMGTTCEPQAFSFQCMTIFTTNKKKKKKRKICSVLYGFIRKEIWHWPERVRGVQEDVSFVFFPPEGYKVSRIRIIGLRTDMAVRQRGDEQLQKRKNLNMLAIWRKSSKWGLCLKGRIGFNKTNSHSFPERVICTKSPIILNFRIGNLYSQPLEVFEDLICKVTSVKLCFDIVLD